MFVMEILQVIVIHFSFDIMRTFASFSGHTLSVEVHTNGCLKLSKKKKKIIGDVAFTSSENLLLFLLQGR